jgi:SAM-dependent methyltransferase
MFPEVHAAAHALAAEMAGQWVQPGEWALDCGAGDLSLARALEGVGLRTLSIDPRGEPGMVRAGWEALPVRAGAVALVTACASLQYATDPRRAIASAAQTLRPGGALLVLLSPVHRTPKGASDGQKTARLRTGNPSYLHFSIEELRGYFGEAGLSFEVCPYRLPAGIGAKRRLKAAFGVEQATFPTLVGRKGR